MMTSLWHTAVRLSIFGSTLTQLRMILLMWRTESNLQLCRMEIGDNKELVEIIYMFYPKVVEKGILSEMLQNHSQPSILWKHI